MQKVQPSKAKTFFLKALGFCALYTLCFSLVSIPYVYAADELINGGDVIGGIANVLGTLIYNLALGIGGLFVGIGGLALDLSIQLLVIEMGNFFHGGYGHGIIQVWQVIRDIFNIVFIFSFIYLGIKTILNADDSGTKRALGYLIVAALFINFSLFITQAIVDFSNVAATQFYNQIISSGGITGTYEDQTIQTGSGSIAGAFLQVSELTTFFGQESKESISGMKLIIYSLVLMVFFIMAGIIFLFAAYHIIYRFVALSIYMILSPVLFIGMILPNFKKYKDDWLKGLLKQSFYAPAFLFLVYVSLMSLGNLKEMLPEGDGGYPVIKDGAAMTEDGFTIFIFFAIVIGFLYASVKVGDIIGINGAGAVIKGIDGVGKAVRGGVQGVVYRNTAGLGLNALVKMQDAASRRLESGKGSWTGWAGAHLGRTLTGGEAGRRALEKGANYGAGGQGREDVEKDKKTSKQRAARGNQIRTIEHDITHGAKAPAGSAERIKMERSVANASSAQLTEMLHDGKDKEIISVAGELSESQVKAIMDDKEINDKTKAQLSEKRGEQVTARLIRNAKPKPATASGAIPPNTIEDAIGSADTSELKAIGFDKLMENNGALVGRLTAKQIEDWKDLTPTEKTQIKAARKAQLIAEFGPGGANASALFVRIESDEERSKLPDAILTDPASAQYLNTNVLSKIVDNNGITEEHRRRIKANVMAALKPGGANADPIKASKFGEWFEKNNAGQRYPD